MNYEMVMERWRGGTKCKPQYWENAERFDLHLSTPEEKAVSRIGATKTRRNLQTFGWCLQFKQSCPWATLSYFCRQKQSRENQYNGASCFKEKCLRKAQHYKSSLKEEKAFCKLNSLTLPPKNHNPLYETGSKKGHGRKRRICDH